MNYSQGLKLADSLGVRVEEDIRDCGEYHGLCLHWDNLVRIRGCLTDQQKLHVLLHELAHATGTEERLNRETLTSYGANEMFTLVEEAVAEGSAVALLLGLGIHVDMNPYKEISDVCDENGIEFDLDILPEVDRVVKYLTPHVAKAMELDK